MVTIIKEEEQLKKNLDQKKLSYPQALKFNINIFKKVNSTNHHKPNNNISERLRSLSPANRKPKQEIIRSRSNSETNLSFNYKYQQEIKQLKKEIKLLKQRKNNHQEETKEIKTSNTRANSKNELQASTSHGGQEKNIELVNVIKLDLKAQLDFNLTHQGK